MSVRFNLLPPELRSREEQKRTQLIVKTTAVIAVSIFLAIFAVLAVFTWMTETNTADLRAKRTALEAELLEYAPYVRMMDRIYQADALLNKAAGNQPNWAQTLHDMNIHLPSGVWLNDLSATYGGSAQKQNQPAAETKAPASPPSASVLGEITMRGQAYSAVDLAEWLKGSEQVSSLSNARFQSTSAQNVNGQPVYQFEIKADIVKSPKSAPLTEKGGKADEG
ncbi:PilN domain-containing protein [Heliophilum fasciatum]|uniref:Tfp pilus assembly protein PilN n=1 Tax=Heliophilum fasciatum TaxID=35700 RepID=A0A4R2RVX1_9FIRM|nr:PilN domain-containing protein [Heliophilum fasciatum]MCW2277271.1 Tfp pilus assembly protein PilN [Heliophilum fasciatum]TCP67109.1 Tfp pilus assembly protein PilN [Heliophilum fasciatum]